MLTQLNYWKQNKWDKNEMEKMYKDDFNYFWIGRRLISDWMNEITKHILHHLPRWKNLDNQLILR